MSELGGISQIDEGLFMTPPPDYFEPFFAQLFDSPNNGDKFQLPPQIESVRVENNSLVIATR